MSGIEVVVLETIANDNVPGSQGVDPLPELGHRQTQPQVVLLLLGLCKVTAGVLFLPTGLFMTTCQDLPVRPINEHTGRLALAGLHWTEGPLYPHLSRLFHPEVPGWQVVGQHRTACRVPQPYGRLV